MSNKRRKKFFLFSIQRNPSRSKEVEMNLTPKDKKFFYVQDGND